MGEGEMSYGLKTPEQWKQESTLSLLFHYDEVEARFMGESLNERLQDNDTDHDWYEAEDYLESLIEWLAFNREEDEVREAVRVYGGENTDFFLGAILGDEC